MSAQRGPETDTLRAAFRTPDEAHAAARRLVAEGIPESDIAVNDPHDRQHMLVRQQRLESERTMPAVGTSAFTPAQIKGSVMWTVMGFVAGALLIGPLGFFITLGSFSMWASVGLFAAVGALAGSTAGFTYGGARQPEVEGELRDNSGDATVSVRPCSPEEADVAYPLLQEAGATDAEYEIYRHVPDTGGT
jgi:outer membrane lipoprotein SlyB